MKYLITLFSVLLFVGCGQKETIVKQTDTVQLQAPTVDIVKQIINDKNVARFNQGQSPLVEGLNCSLYDVSTSNPTTIPSNPNGFITSFAYIGPFNQRDAQTSIGLNILPNGLKTQYTQWFILRCSGYFVATDSVYYKFNLTSDDGSMLYLDGGLLVNNDGLHGSQLRSGTKYLEKGLHSFRLDYLQAAGQQKLVLEDENGIINSKYFYR